MRIEVTAAQGGGGAGGEGEGTRQFVPVAPQPLRQLRLCLGSPEMSPGPGGGSSGVSGHLSLGLVKVDYDETGRAWRMLLVSSSNALRTLVSFVS